MTTANKLNQTEVTVKRFEPSEEGPAEMKGAELKLKEGFSQREPSGVFGAQTHRPAAIHYKEGGWGGGVKKITDEI